MDKSSSYSQNQEQQAIVGYFGTFKGTLVDIGANDGVNFSNSRRLVEMGWIAHLVEPDPGAYGALVESIRHFPKAVSYEVAIGSQNGRETLKSFEDSLLSILSNSEREGFDHFPVKEEVEVEVQDWATFFSGIGSPDIDFLSIDAEGMDLKILEQIDLSGIRMVCVEKSQDYQDDKKARLCMDAGMKLIYQSFENLIFAR